MRASFPPRRHVIKNKVQAAYRRTDLLSVAVVSWRIGRPISRASEQAPRPDLTSRPGSEAVSGRPGGVSGNLRALGSPQIDDLGFPRGRGRAKNRRSAESAAIARKVTGPPVALAVLEALDREAEQLARDGSVSAVPGDARRAGFGGSAEGWLTFLRSVSQPTRCKTFALWRGVLRPPSIPPKKPRSGSVRGWGVRPLPRRANVPQAAVARCPPPTTRPPFVEAVRFRG